MKKVARNSIATNEEGVVQCRTRTNSLSMKEKNLSLQDRAVTVLSEEEWDQVVEMLENPPELSPKLIKAIERYREVVN